MKNNVKVKNERSERAHQTAETRRVQHSEYNGKAVKVTFKAFTAMMMVIIMMVSCFSVLAEGVGTPSDIPETPAGCQHNWITKFNDNGHWNECAVCGEKSSIEEHKKVWTEKIGNARGITNVCGHQQKCIKCNWLGTFDMHDNKKTYDQPDTCEGVRIVHSHCTVCGLDDEWEELFSDFHDYGDWTKDEVHTPATCTQPEWFGWICKRCGHRLTGDVYSTKKGHEGEKITFKPLGHDWKETVTTPATCTAEGSMSRVCARCGAKETSAVIPKLEHKWTSQITTPATCKTAGVKTYTCTMCGTTKTEAIPAGTNHVWQETVITPATCTTEGVKKTVCTVCGESKTEKIAKKPHSYTENITLQPTCTSTGTKESMCSVCGDKKTETIPMKPHTYSETVTSQPTCTLSGEKKLTCTVCGTSKTEAIPATGHNWKETVTKKATCTSEGTKKLDCTVCGETEEKTISATGHNYSQNYTMEDGVTHTRKCSHCGKVSKENCELVSTELNGIVYTVCNKCSYLSIKDGNGNETTSAEMDITVLDGITAANVDKNAISSKARFTGHITKTATADNAENTLNSTGNGVITIYAEKSGKTVQPEGKIEITISSSPLHSSWEEILSGKQLAVMAIGSTNTSAGSAVLENTPYEIKDGSLVITTSFIGTFLILPAGTVTDVQIVPDSLPELVFEEETEEIVQPQPTVDPKKCKHNKGYRFESQWDGKHIKTCNLCGKQTTEKCTLSCKVKGSDASFSLCPRCGYGTATGKGQNGQICTYECIPDDTDVGLKDGENLSVTYVICDFTYKKKPVYGFFMIGKMTDKAGDSLKAAKGTDIKMQMPAIENFDGKKLSYIKTSNDKTSLVDIDTEVLADGTIVFDVTRFGIYLIMDK